MFKRFALILAFFGVGFSLLYLRIFYITENNQYKSAAANQGSYTLTINKTYANIYDCNMLPFNNRTEKYIAVINPTSQNVINIMSYVKDKDYFYKQIQSGKPFTCEVTVPEIKDSNIQIFPVKVRTSDDQLASHIIGYTIDNKGVTGIEKSFNSFLRSNYSSSKISYKIDGTGKLLQGANENIDLEEDTKAGVVTTLDYNIQSICEKAAKKIQKGAIVVMDPYTGELKAVVSIPDFSPTNISKSLKDKDQPFINRAFSAYNVGSIFKLVTASTAIEQRISTDLSYTCTGKIDVDGQNFNCHKLSGHGKLDMQNAMVQSCNTYFINLSKSLQASNFLSKASSLGFGKETILADGIVSVKGNLQTEQDLINPAEKANMAFGQGKLTATPLQIACMTSAIVNDGKYTNAKLIKGTTDGVNIVPYEKENECYQAIESATAYQLRKFMVATVQTNDASEARPYNTTAAGKTSTAQTGKFNEKGNEYLEAWFTGYFPIKSPKYVVTVFIEDGVTGNSSAGPVFKEIAEGISRLK